MDQPIDHQANNDSGLHFFGRPVALLLIIAYKILWGCIEIVSGILIFFSSRLVGEELTEDPQDLLANWLLSHLHFSYPSVMHFAILIVALGIGKLLLAIGLWYRLWFIRHGLIIFFSIITLFGVHRLVTRFSPLTLFAVIIDGLILYYLWKILPRHLSDKKIFSV